MTTNGQNEIGWPSDPKGYQWKGTISMHAQTWSVLAHCTKRVCDVFIKIKQLELHDNNENLEEIAENTRNLINLKHPNLLTPVHSFHHKNDIWIIYPRSSGGPLSELLKSHYPNGIPNESIVAYLLKNAALGLHNLHQHQIVHRNIRAASLHIDRDEGTALLTEFGVLKEIKFKHAKTRNNTMVPTNRFPWTDPLILAGDPTVSWFNGDVYSFGITALEITFGEVPPSKVLPPQQALQNGGYSFVPVSVDSYDKPCPFGKQYQQLIKDCCTDRMNINTLVKHAFFKKACKTSVISEEICHLIKSIESRVNPAFMAPVAFPNVRTVIDTPLQSSASRQESINFDFDTETLSMSVQRGDPSYGSGTSGGGTGLQNSTIVEEEQGGHRHANVENGNGHGHGNNNHASAPNTSISQTQSQAQVQVKIDAIINGSNGKSRIRRVSWSASDSHSLTDIPTDESGAVTGTHINVTNADASANVSTNANPPDKMGRFKIEVLNANGDEENDGPINHYGRFAVATGKQTPQSVNHDLVDQLSMDTNQNNQHQQNQHQPNQHQQQQQNQHQNHPNQHQNQPNQHQSQTQHAQQQTQNQNSNHQPPQQQQLIGNNHNIPRQPQQIQARTAPTHTPSAVEPEAEQRRSADVIKWTVNDCAEWLSSLGNSYVQYQEAFISDGIDGEMMKEFDDEMLLEIVPKKLHRKKIILSAQRLFSSS